MMNPRKTGIKKVSLILATLLLSAWVPSEAQALNPASTKFSKPSSPIEVRLFADHSPPAGEILRLTMEVRPLIDAPLMSIEYILPEGVELVSGESSWTGSLDQGEIKELRIIVRPAARHLYIVQGMATIDHGEGRSYSAVDSLSINLVRADSELQGIIKNRSPLPSKKTRDQRDVQEYGGSD